MDGYFLSYTYIFFSLTSCKKKLLTSGAEGWVQNDAKQPCSQGKGHKEDGTEELEIRESGDLFPKQVQKPVQEATGGWGDGSAAQQNLSGWMTEKNSWVWHTEIISDSGVFVGLGAQFWKAEV